MCVFLTSPCFSADQWGAYQDELAKEEGLEYPNWMKSIATIIFKILTASLIFFTVSGYGNGVKLLSLRGILGTVIGIVALTWSFIYHNTFMASLEYLIKGIAIIIGAIIVIGLLYNGISRVFLRKPNK